MTDVCVASTTRAAMDYGFESTIIPMLLRQKKQEFNGKVILAEHVTRSYLSGLNALVVWMLNWNQAKVYKLKVSFVNILLSKNIMKLDL
jgi:hypothetical protein